MFSSQQCSDDYVPSREPGDPRLSVLIIGVDSVSRLNYFRTMPRTSELLRSHGWYELRGYNKVEDNTFPNLMAILTGMTRPQVVIATMTTRIRSFSQLQQCAACGT